MAGVKGRSGPQRHNIWSDAINRAIKRRQDDDPKALERLADRLLSKCDEGDLPALKELGDRLDGKAAQQLVLSGTGADGSIPLVVTGVRRPTDA